MAFKRSGVRFPSSPPLKNSTTTRVLNPCGFFVLVLVPDWLPIVNFGPIYALLIGVLIDTAEPGRVIVDALVGHEVNLRH